MFKKIKKTIGGLLQKRAAEMMKNQPTGAMSNFFRTYISSGTCLTSFDCNGNRLVALIDTGCGESMISPEALKRIGVKPSKTETKHKIATASGIVEESKSEVVLSIKRNDITYNHKFLARDLGGINAAFEKGVVDIVLGIDFLLTYGWTIDFYSFTIIERNEPWGHVL